MNLAAQGVLLLVLVSLRTPFSLISVWLRQECQHLRNTAAMGCLHFPLAGGRGMAGQGAAVPTGRHVVCIQSPVPGGRKQKSPDFPTHGPKLRDPASEELAPLPWWPLKGLNQRLQVLLERADLG
jgi:hypothetical protein